MKRPASAPARRPTRRRRPASPSTLGCLAESAAACDVGLSVADPACSTAALRQRPDRRRRNLRRRQHGGGQRRRRRRHLPARLQRDRLLADRHAVGHRSADDRRPARSTPWRWSPTTTPRSAFPASAPARRWSRSVTSGVFATSPRDSETALRIDLEDPSLTGIGSGAAAEVTVHHLHRHPGDRRRLQVHRGQRRRRRPSPRSSARPAPSPFRDPDEKVRRPEDEDNFTQDRSSSPAWRWRPQAADPPYAACGNLNNDGSGMTSTDVTILGQCAAGILPDDHGRHLRHRQRARLRRHRRGRRHRRPRRRRPAHQGHRRRSAV